ncbi:hypothetical protein CQ018_03980 [Arthrobacter sp. MYb227]|uniref:hypothetical protein n=1 Tax=Arthrobacter sp. MYb227 TaxID=1848601 RepID=UPI000CFC0975|nr:hypothetical protein [Arthrobacter sp. MYb227]PQZ96419.1 hypothetical protein CQ018_03980 [Arthrobacter sp. MYb227]
MKKSSRYLAALALCLASTTFTSCSAPEPQAEPDGYQQWLETVFDDEYGRADFAGGGGMLGSTITNHEVAGGWYAVDFACKGTAETTFIISTDNSTLVEESIPCGESGLSTTVMDLPSASISSTAKSSDPNTMWQVRFRPTSAPVG